MAVPIFKSIYLMKNVLIITGYSASGKSTLAENVCITLGNPLISTRKLLSELAVIEGYQNIDSFVDTIPKEKFKKLFDNYLIRKINTVDLYSNLLIIDGLVSFNLLKQLIKNGKYNIKIIYIEVPEKERFRRILEREKIQLETAIIKDHKKNNSKRFLGIERIKNMADYILDGTLTPLELLYKTVEIINKITYKVHDKHLYNNFLGDRLFRMQFLLFNLIQNVTAVRFNI